MQQGYPISADLFVLIGEFLVNATRKSPGIIAITKDNAELTISQYADNIYLYLPNVNSLQTMSIIFEPFKNYSGIKIWSK